VHHVYSTPELDEVRSRGGLRANSFARLRKVFVDRNPVVEVEDLGNAEDLLGDARHFEQAAQYLESGTVMPQEFCAGWLGRYQKALQVAAQGLDPKPCTDSGRAAGAELSSVRLDVDCSPMLLKVSL
jgi:hypothetical protein